MWFRLGTRRDRKGPLSEATNAHVLYDIPLYLALGSGIVWVVLAFLLKRDGIIAVIAGLSTLWVGMIFMISDLDEAEEAVLTGIADEQMAQFFLRINVPIHACFAVIENLRPHAIGQEFLGSALRLSMGFNAAKPTNMITGKTIADKRPQLRLLLSATIPVSCGPTEQPMSPPIARIANIATPPEG